MKLAARFKLRNLCRISIKLLCVFQMTLLQDVYEVCCVLNKSHLQNVHKVCLCST
jgi:hypothetical protein